MSVPKKCILVVFVTLLFIISCITFVFADESEFPFTDDVNPGCTVIQLFSEKIIFSGINANMKVKVKTANITQLKIIMELQKLKNGKYSTTDKWAEFTRDYILVVEKSKIINPNEYYRLKVTYTANNETVVSYCYADEYSELFGDTDKDGVLTLKDARLLLRYIAKLSGFNSYQVYISDINKDGTINVKDVRKILRIKAKLDVL